MQKAHCMAGFFSARYFFTALVFFTLPEWSQAAPYLILDLGTLDGGKTFTSDYGNALNNLGQVVGYSLGTKAKPFRTLPNQAISVTDAFPNINEGKAFAINDSGQTVFENVSVAYVTSPNGGGSSIMNLGNSGGFTNVRGINNAGQVVGAIYVPGGTHAFRTTPNGVITADSDLAPVFGGTSFAFGVNSSGQATGSANFQNSTSAHAFRTAPNGKIDASSDLGAFSGDESEAYAINNSGQVVGDSLTAADGQLHAFRTTANGTILPNSDLGTLGGVISRAHAINSAGQAVGYYSTSLSNRSENRAFLADASGPMQDLNTMIRPESGWVLNEAHGINDKGQIAGVGTINGQTHAFLTVARGAIVTASASPPVSAAISQPNFSAMSIDPNKDYSDNAGPPGQTFKPTANMTLNAITVKGFSKFSSGSNPMMFTITISRVNGTKLTVLEQEPTDIVLPASPDDYLTFTLANPVTLTGGTQYAFDISNELGFFGFAKSSTNVYADGSAFQSGSTRYYSSDGVTLTNLQSVDRTFFINPTPEPTTLGFIALGSGALLTRHRRKRTDLLRP